MGTYNNNFGKTVGGRGYMHTKLEEVDVEVNQHLYKNKSATVVLKFKVNTIHFIIHNPKLLPSSSPSSGVGVMSEFPNEP